MIMDTVALVVDDTVDSGENIEGKTREVADNMMHHIS